MYGETMSATLGLVGAGEISLSPRSSAAFAAAASLEAEYLLSPRFLFLRLVSPFAAALVAPLVEVTYPTGESLNGRVAYFCQDHTKIYPTLACNSLL